MDNVSANHGEHGEDGGRIVPLLLNGGQRGPGEEMFVCWGEYRWHGSGFLNFALGDRSA